MGRPRKNIEANIFGSAEENNDMGLNVDAGENVKVPPRMCDPGWTDYVLSQLTDDEMSDKFPKTEGLRRLVTKLLGDIIESKSELVCSPNYDNVLSTVVSHKLTILTDEGSTKTFTGLADASPRNLDGDYDKYPSAVASTRALGRAVRDALQLKNIVVAEEISKASPDDKVLSVQVVAIKNLSDKLGLNVMKVINFSNKIEMFKRVEDLDRQTAQEVMRKLNELQQNTGNLEEYK